MMVHGGFGLGMETSTSVAEACAGQRSKVDSPVPALGVGFAARGGRQAPYYLQKLWFYLRNLICLKKG
jgi:hypothetical protein